MLASGLLVRLASTVEGLSALLLSFVLGFLVLLAWRVLPCSQAIARRRRYPLIAAAGSVSLVGLLWTSLALGL